MRFFRLSKYSLICVFLLLLLLTQLFVFYPVFLQPKWLFHCGTAIDNDCECNAEIIVNGSQTKVKQPSKFYLSRVNVEGKSTFTYNLYGIFYAPICEMSEGSKHKETVVEYNEVETSILYEFSPHIKRHVAKMFSEQVQAAKWFSVYPFQVSCLPLSGVLNCAIRVWLRLDRFKNRKAELRDRFQDSFIYFCQFDHTLTYVPDSGRLISIPSPIQDLFYTGPEDPRLFQVNGELFLNFVMGQASDDGKQNRKQFVWSLDKNVLHDINVQGVKLGSVEKNWTPWVDNDGNFSFIYRFSPELQIMRCEFPQREDSSMSLKCRFTLPRQEGDIGKSSSSSDIFLRGGSPLVHYIGDYYLALTHSVQYKRSDLIYAAQLVLVNGKTMQVVFLSSPILIEPKLMARVKTTAPTIGAPFLYARSVFVENKNGVVFAAGLNDNESYLIRLRGIAQLLKAAMENDQMIQSTCDKNTLKNVKFRFTRMEDWMRAKNLAVLNIHAKERPEIA